MSDITATTAIFYDGPAIDVTLESYQHQRLLFNFQQHVINRQWDCLHDNKEFFHLRDAIISHLNQHNNNNM